MSVPEAMEALSCTPKTPRGLFGGMYMATKSARIVGGLLLVVAGVLIGHGVGQLISELTGKSVQGSMQVIGLGIGLLAAVLFARMWKQ